MDKAYIESIIAIAEEHDLDALEVEDDSGAVRVVRRGGSAALPMAAPPSQESVGKRAATGGPPLPEGVQAATSPVVGVFCAAPPEGGSPVQPGDAVTMGQVLGHVEAMKMATEVTAPVDGTVVEILAAEGQAVQFGDPLFLIQAGGGE